MGARFVLLDSVRDATFLNVSTKDALGNNIADMGLGVVENGLFLFTSNKAPSGVPFTKQDTFGNRLYPVKFFWLGSPKGTTDATDVFSLFVADVVQGAFSSGALPSTWLVNPRLVLSAIQANNNATSWLVNNYPVNPNGTRIAVNGASASNTLNADGKTYTFTGVIGSVGANTYSTYGTTGSPTSGNGTGGTTDVYNPQTIDGQFWPIYDTIDNSLLLYFSMKKTDNNIVGIYCYKTIANEGAEILTPLSSTQFQGGLSGVGWLGYDAQTGSVQPNNLTNGSQGILASEKFLVSSDLFGEYGNNVLAPNKQSAVFMYAHYAFGSTPNHGANALCSTVQDIHGSPLSPGVGINPMTGNILSVWESRVDYGGIGEIDKFGSLFLSDGHSYGYLYNMPTEKDFRGASNSVALSAMQIRMGTYEPFFGRISGVPEPLLLDSGNEIIGRCRPQYTKLPDGLPKIMYAAFRYDQSLTIEYEYIDENILRPENHRSIIFTVRPGSGNGSVQQILNALPTYSKKKLSVTVLGSSYNFISIGFGAQNGQGFNLPIRSYHPFFDITQTPYCFDGKQSQEGAWNVWDFDLDDFQAGDDVAQSVQMMLFPATLPVLGQVVGGGGVMICLRLHD